MQTMPWAIGIGKSKETVTTVVCEQSDMGKTTCHCRSAALLQLLHYLSCKNVVYHSPLQLTKPATLSLRLPVDCLLTWAANGQCQHEQ